MDAVDETIIYLSRTKILLLLLGAFAFVAAGIWMFSLGDASIQSQRRFNEPLYVRGLGLAAILFFGSCGLYALKKLFDRKPALVFNSSGIVDNASSVAAGLIPWSDVVSAG
ncbi:MAG TPA: STM3941 family protein, partial [Pyrinomonadaceae bacterium]